MDGYDGYDASKKLPKTYRFGKKNLFKTQEMLAFFVRIFVTFC